MDNLLFSLNATMPIFLMMVLGFFFLRIGIIDEPFADKLNRFCFQAVLPVMLFRDLSTSDFYAVWDGKLVLFCFVVTILCILFMVVISLFMKDKSIQGEFVQASFRSSPALVGVTFLQNIYGEAGAAPLMIIGAVPLYNIASVILLTLMKPGRGKLDGTLIKRAARDVVTNPLLIGIAAGLCWSLLRIPQPTIMQKAISSYAAIATPLGLIALGASFDLSKAFANLRPALICSFFKLLGFAAVFLPLAVWLGFRDDKLVSILVMLGAATTVSAFTMAKNMGHEATLSSSTVMITTVLSAFTLTGWLTLLKSLGLI